MTKIDPLSSSRRYTNLLILLLTAATTVLVFAFGWTSADGVRTSRELAFMLSLAYILLYLRRWRHGQAGADYALNNHHHIRRDPWLLNHFDLAVYWLAVGIVTPYCV